MPASTLAPAPNTAALAALATPDRTTLFRAAALAAADAARLPDALAPASVGAGAPAPLAAASPPVADGAGAALVSLIRALPGSGGAPAGSAVETASIPIGDRLSLSPAASSLNPADAALPRTPVGRFALDLLESLTGEPRSALQFLEPGLRSTTGSDYVALAARDPDALLRLVLQGSVRGEDGQVLDLSLRLSVQPQPGAALPDLAARVAIRAALDALAQTRPLLDIAGPAAQLAGQRLPFDAAFDPRLAWALPGFYLSGLLMLGLARGPDVRENAWEPDAPDDEARDTDEPPERQAEDAPQDQPPRRKRKPKPPENELTPLPADGGLPIISARRWLELELRHIQRQLRLWMMLPAPG